MANEFKIGDQVRAIHRNDAGEITCRGDQVFTVNGVRLSSRYGNWFWTGHIECAPYRDMNDYELVEAACD